MESNFARLFFISAESAAVGDCACVARAPNRVHATRVTENALRHRRFDAAMGLVSEVKRAIVGPVRCRRLR
jgi:hypothetical protein